MFFFLRCKGYIIRWKNNSQHVYVPKVWGENLQDSPNMLKGKCPHGFHLDFQLNQRSTRFPWLGRWVSSWLRNPNEKWRLQWENMGNIHKSWGGWYVLMGTSTINGGLYPGQIIELNWEILHCPGFSEGRPRYFFPVPEHFMNPPKKIYPAITCFAKICYLWGWANPILMI